MKEFTFKNVTKKLLRELEECEDVAAVKAYINAMDFEISDENAEKLYRHVNTVHEMSDGEAAGTAGGGCSSDESNCVSPE